jgi:hypothetical protein
MNIFYAAASVNLPESDSSLLKLVDSEIPKYLESLGNNVYFYQYDPSRKDGYSSFQEINQQISICDLYIGEMSRASQSLGFQLSYALSLSKPCLYLFREGRSGTPDNLLTENPSRLLRIKTYNDNNYKKVLDKFLRSAAKQLPSKRTSFMSTTKIDDFITLKAKELGISKGEAIRQILDSASEI